MRMHHHGGLLVKLVNMQTNSQKTRDRRKIGDIINLKMDAGRQETAMSDSLSAEKRGYIQKISAKQSKKSSKNYKHSVNYNIFCDFFSWFRFSEFDGLFVIDHRQKCR